MKKNCIRVVIGTLVSISFLSCDSGLPNNRGSRDTAMKTSPDTAVISVTPGTQGREPGLKDSSRSGSEGLKRTHTIVDSAK